MDRKQRLYQAQQYATWSIVGILMPFIGLILSLVSISTLNSLKPFKESEVGQAAHARNTAETGLRLSVILLAIMLVGGVILGYNYVQEQQRREEAVQQYLDDLKEIYQ